MTEHAAPTAASTPDAPSPEHFPGFGAADLQVHTAWGDGMGDARAVFDRIERLGLVDVVAITDHDDVGGALQAREVHEAGGYHFDLVTGIEVTTRAGHLLALWVEEPIASFRSLPATIEAIHRAGGLAVVPHPFSYLTRSVGQRSLERLLRIEDRGVRPDGIEVANLSLAGRVTGAKALRLNRERYRLPETGGSDAHFLEDIGSAYTLFRTSPGAQPGSGSVAADLRRALEAGETMGRAGRARPLRSIGVRRLAQQQVRGLSVTPRKVLGPALGRVIRLGRRREGAPR